MSRPLWFAAGAGVGVYAAARARRLAESLTADGLRDRVSTLRHGARLFAEEVVQAKTDRETQLRADLGLVPHGRRELGLDRPPRSLGGDSTNENDHENDREIED